MSYFRSEKKEFNPQPKVVTLKQALKAFKKITIPALQKELDEVFGAYIRKRDKDKSCICCGKRPTKSNPLQCGHCYSRRILALRWDEVNCAGQLLSCNIFNQGNFPGFANGIIARYGESALKHLEMKIHNKVKMGRFEYELLITEYKNKIKSL